MQDSVEVILDRNTAEMHDCVDVATKLEDGGTIADVAGDGFLVGLWIVRSAKVRDPERLAPRGEEGTQHAAESPGGSGEQQAAEGGLEHWHHREALYDVVQAACAQAPGSKMASTPSLRDAPNLTDQVVAALRQRVEAGEFAKGAKLPSEGELVAVYRVSRTVVREAISQLRARGLVETRRGVGTFARPTALRPPFPVPSVDPATLGEVIALLELRMSLETEAAALAAKRASPSQIERLRVLLEAIESAAHASDDAADPDFEFHLTVAEATGNHYFSDLLRHLGRTIIPRTRLDSSAAARQERSDYLRGVNREHQDIFRAIARSDADAARAAMRTHLANSRERLRGLQGSAAADN